jgi:hypothetical protein
MVGDRPPIMGLVAIEYEPFVHLRVISHCPERRFDIVDRQILLEEVCKKVKKSPGRYAQTITTLTRHTTSASASRMMMIA